MGFVVWIGWNGVKKGRDEWRGGEAGKRKRGR